MIWNHHSNIRTLIWGKHTWYETFKGIQKITCKRLAGIEPSTENKCEDVEILIHTTTWEINGWMGHHIGIWHNVTDNAFKTQSQVSFLTTATTAIEARGNMQCC